MTASIPRTSSPSESSNRSMTPAPPTEESSFDSKMFASATDSTTLAEVAAHAASGYAVVTAAAMAFSGGTYARTDGSSCGSFYDDEDDGDFSFEEEEEEGEDDDDENDCRTDDASSPCWTESGSEDDLNGSGSCTHDIALEDVHVLGDNFVVGNGRATAARSGSCCSSFSYASGEMGEMMLSDLEEIDPDAVDFQPLLVSASGAAVSRLPRGSSPRYKDDQNGSGGGGAGGWCFRTLRFGDLRKLLPLRRLRAPALFPSGVIRSCLSRVKSPSFRSVRVDFSFAKRGCTGLKSRATTVFTRLKSVFGVLAVLKSVGVVLLTFPRRTLQALCKLNRSMYRRLIRPLVLVVTSTATATPRRATALVSSAGNLAVAAAREDASLGMSFSVCVAFFALILLSSSVSSYLGSMMGATGGSGRAVTKFGAGIGGSSASMLRHGALAAAGVDLAPPKGIKLPKTLDVMADVDDLPLELMDTAVFWHVPRSGGTTMKHVTATCLGRVVTTEVGGQEGHAMDERLEIIQKPYGNFVNVDTTTPLGLKRAKTLGLAPSRVADVVFTPYIHETTILFDMDHRGRFFTVLRDPVSRMQSLYYFRRMNGSLGDKTLEEFIRTAGENWMVRTLTDSMSGRIDVAMLDVAKEILRRKFLVGLFDEKTETLRRIELFFGWKFSSPVSQSCKNQLYYFEWLSHNPHPELEPDNPLTVLIQRQNRYDMELYEYAIQLFQEQEQLFWGGDEEEDGGQIVNQIGGIM